MKAPKILQSVLLIVIRVTMMAVAFVVFGTQPVSGAETLRLVGAGFRIADPDQINVGGASTTVALDRSGLQRPFSQSAVKQGWEAAQLGPEASRPYFTVRFALPIPPDNATNQSGQLAGVDEDVWAHNHSPGFEVLPNGDVLAIYFSARMASGEAECANDTRFVQARLRFGAEEWDMPELFYDLKDCNEQSGLLWTEGNSVRFFGGGRGASDWLPFKMATSTNNGETWQFALPQLDQPAADYTAQPIANAFRGADGAMYFAMDAEKDNSFLWRSLDGVHWSDTGGRTGARHSTIIPLAQPGSLISIGGKNASVGGWSPMNSSSDYGRTWSASTASAFPPLGGNQRPCLIRLANGHLLLVSDSYFRKTGQAPEGFKVGPGCFVAISTNNAQTWHCKPLPVALPHEKDRNFGTLGYATVRQAPNGVIHVLATMTHPCVHYEFNEAWVLSDVGDIQAETGGGKLRKFRENYSNGKTRVMWSARICPNGRYLLDGKEASYFPDGQKEHEVTYVAGRKTGTETFWATDGRKVWSWSHDPRKNVSIWTQFWPDGKKKLESTWSTRPQARDLNRRFLGRVANGPVRHWKQDGSLEWSGSFVNGEFAGKDRL